MARTQGQIDKTRSSSEMRREVEISRAELDRTIDALERRLEPKTLVHRIQDAVVYQVRQSDAGRTIRNNPVASIVSAVGLTSAAGGLTWLLSHGPEGKAASSESGRIKAARERVKEVASEASRKVGKWREQMGEEYEEMADEGEKISGKAKRQAGQAKERVGEAAQRAKSKLRQSSHDAWQSLREHPLVTGFATMAAGVVLGSLFPASRAEKRTLGEVGEEALEQGVKTGEEAGEKIEEATKKAVASGRQEPQPTTVVETTQDLVITPPEEKPEQKAA